MHNNILKKFSSVNSKLGLIVFLFLIWAILDHSLAYYTFLRWITCGLACYYAYLAYSFEPKGWFGAFIFIALLFNPIYPVKLNREIWAYIDFVTAIFFIVSILTLENSKGESKDENLGKDKPIDIDVINTRGNLKFKEKDYNGAILEYSKAIEINPDFEKAYHNRALAHNKLENYNEAIKDYNKLIEINPINETAYYNRGNAKRDLEDFKGAIIDYSKAIKINPNLALAYKYRGISRIRLQDNLDAIKDFSKALEINPNDETVYYSRGIVRIFFRDFDEAIQDFVKAVQINPNYDAAFKRINEAKRKLEFYDNFIKNHREEEYVGEMKDLFKFETEVNPYADAYYYNGMLKYELEDYLGAIEAFNKSIELKTICRELAYLNRGNARRSLGKYEDAMKDYDKVIERTPYTVEAYTNRGLLKNTLKDFSGAIDDFNKAVEIATFVASYKVKLEKTNEATDEIKKKVFR